MNMFAVVGRSTQKVNAVTSAPRMDEKLCEIDASSTVKTYHDPSCADAEPRPQGRIPVIAVLFQALMSELSKLGFRIRIAAELTSRRQMSKAIGRRLGI
jgi:hypothetical protein